MPPIDYIDDHLWVQPAFKHITADDVAKSLYDFELVLVGGKDWEWLAMAIRRALSVHPPIDYLLKPPITAKTKKALAKRAKVLKAAYDVLRDEDETVNGFVSGVLYDLLDGEATSDGDDPILQMLKEQARHDQLAELLRLQNLTEEIRLLAVLYKFSEKRIGRLRPKAKETKSKTLRIHNARLLAPVFQSAFDRRPTANNHPSGKELEATPFMVFYSKVSKLAFNEDISVNSNKAEVVKTALREDKKQRLDLSYRIPDL